MENLTTNKKYICEICKKAYSSKSNLKLHFSNVHEEGNRHHKCESCGKSFSQAVHLKGHIQIVQGIKITNVILVAKHFLRKED